MKWTTEKPTEPGWYWCRMPKVKHPFVVYVKDGMVYDRNWTEPLIHFYKTGEWQGPITPQEDAP